MFHSIFQFFRNVQVLVYLFAFFYLYSGVNGNGQIHETANSLFFKIAINPYKFFTPALADGLSLEAKWQQFSSSLQDCLCILAGLRNAVGWMVSARPPIFSSSNSVIKTLGDCCEFTSYNWYHRHFPIP